MAQIVTLAQVLNGYTQNVALTSNTLVVQSLQTGSTSGNILTDTILGRLISLQNGTDVDTTYHTHDTVYTRTTALAASTGTVGSTLIGDSNTYSNFTPAAATVKGALSGIDSALAGVSGSAITSLTGDVTAAGPGAAAATVASVGGSSASDVHSAELKANAATSSNTSSTIVARDGSGNFTATTITAALTGHASADLALTGGTMSGAIAMGSNKITGLTSGSASGDALQFGQIGIANGLAGLDGSGKVPYSQLPSTLMIYLGAWDASTNTPTLADGTGSNGDVYRVSVAGTQNLGSGSQTFAVGDFVIYNGTIWQHSPAADGVSSVNSMTGAVTINAINQLTGDVTSAAASGSQSEASTVASIQGTTVSGTTGTGNVVFSAAPTLTGLLSGASASFSSTIAASNFSGSSSGTNSGDQTITLTGDVTGSGTGSFATTIAAASVTAAKLSTVTDGVTLDQSGAGSTLEIKAGGVGTTQLASSSVTIAKLGTITDGVTLDQSGTSSSLEVKAGGIGSTQLASSSVTAAKLGSITDGVTLDQSGSGATLEVKTGGISATQLASNSVTAAKIATSAVGSGLTGGGGTAISVDVDSSTITIVGGVLQANQVPLIQQSLVAGTTFAANTSYLVRWGINANSETTDRIYPADASSAAANQQFHAIGIAQSSTSVSAGQNISVVMIGSYAIGSSDTAFSSAVVGLPVWLTTSGAYSTTAPTTSGYAAYKIGMVQSTTQIWVDGKQLMGIN